MTELLTRLPENVTESDSERVHHAMTVKMMDRLHAEEIFTSPEDSKAFLDTLSYDEFKEWISYVNGLERGIPKTERGKVSNSQVRGSRMFGGSWVEYQPPHEGYRDQLLHKAFDKAQSIENPHMAGLTLGIAINAIHYFEDGNGRTARMTYALLDHGFDGSNGDKEYFSSLLANTSGREIINPNPENSSLARSVKEDLYRRTQTKFGYDTAFDGNVPTYFFDGYNGAFADELSPQALAVSENIDPDDKRHLHEVMTDEGFTMISLMAAFIPERVQEFVKTSSDGKRTFIEGDKFLPTLTHDEIVEWWKLAQRLKYAYVQKLIDMSDREDVDEIAAQYNKQKHIDK